MSEVQDMPIADWLDRQGYGCDDGGIMLSFGPTTADAWATCTVASYQLIGWRDAVADGLLPFDQAALESVIGTVQEIHACVSESERGVLCGVFDDSQWESSWAWALDWIAHIEAKHGGFVSAAGAQIADAIRAAVGVNPYAG